MDRKEFIRLKQALLQNLKFNVVQVWKFCRSHEIEPETVQKLLETAKETDGITWHYLSLDKKEVYTAAFYDRTEKEAELFMQNLRGYVL